MLLLKKPLTDGLEVTDEVWRYCTHLYWPCFTVVIPPFVITVHTDTHAHKKTGTVFFPLLFLFVLAQQPLPPLRVIFLFSLC